MKTTIQKLFACFFLLSHVQGYSQIVTGYCGSARYDQEIFSGVTITSDTSFGSNTDYSGANVVLTMDIYEPTGDTASMRPLIVWAHGGSFLGGSKNDPDVTSLCNHFAKRGYVCASINYRTGMNGANQTSATQAVYRAVQDMKASIRFFRKDASSTNTYRIDSNLVIAAGSSAGAFTALHLAYLNQPSELPSAIDTTVLGGMEGNSGNPGYSSTVNAVVNLCGALGNKNWLVPGDIPLCSMHGTIDNTVPYATAMLYIINIFPIMVVDGSYSINDHANSVGVWNEMYTWYGADHVPYAGSTAYMDTTVRFVSNFLYQYMGCTPADPNPLPNTFINVAVAENAAAENDLLVYPNPAEQNITIRSDRYRIQKLELFDVTGRAICSIMNNQASDMIISKENIPAGIYFLKVYLNGQRVIRKICFR
ncbi:MAG: T9SS type A sorting domain-containing protein [Bacteroidetes bacterium]|nr:T9SS type A sorting domain-containing protein [Bacteroidota bacterium]